MTTWRHVLGRPITASLALSVAIHVAVILLVQSRPNTPGATTQIITARLVVSPKQAESRSPEPVLSGAKSLTKLPVTVAKVALPKLPTQQPVSSKPDPQNATLPSLPLGIDSTWYLARQVDLQPKAIGRIDPVYPQLAREKGIAGSVKLRLRIDDLGRVKEADVVEADPEGVFDQAALSAFSQARFQPAMKDGRPVRIEAYYRVDFKP